jgi:phosphotriesterase-related protein
MSDLSRRAFLVESCAAAAGLLATGARPGPPPGRQSPAASFRGRLLTVLGPIKSDDLGPTLPHEHILVDFVGADQTGLHRYDRREVIRVMLPHLRELRRQGVTGFVDCTPMFLARDPVILASLAEQTGLHILTNTGQYKEPYLPEETFRQDADGLAAGWTAEIVDGIRDTGVRAGFIKIAVFEEPLKPMQQKIVRAACRTHRATGATIACHAGHGPAAMEILDIMEAEQVPSDALVVVHAQGEKDRGFHERIAERGAWVEYDNIGARTPAEHLELLRHMLDRGYEQQILISMDRGWYSVGEPGGGDIKPFTYLFGEFLPYMRRAGIEESTISRLTTTNPALAFRLDPE